MQSCKFHNVEQNSEEWFSLRMGRFTASTFKSLFAAKSTAEYQKAINKVVFEKLTNEAPESFKNEYMERGSELEPIAIEQYELNTFNDTTNGGFFSIGDYIGASPDRLIDDDGMVEAKCPAYNTMITYLLKKELPYEYKYQVHGQLYVTGRKWCDFIAYHPKLKMLIIRVERDEAIISEIKQALEEAIKLVEYRISQIK